MTNKNSFSNNIFFTFLLLTVISISFSCKSSKVKIEEIPTKCNTHGSVRDYSNVEDCGFIIELESGMFIFPQSFKSGDKGFHFESGQSVRLDYTLLQNAISLCPVKGKVAEITCITKLPDRDINCLDCDSPSSDWMLQLISILKPNSIYKYLTDNEILYLFDCPSEKVLYNCLGNCLCQEFKNDNSKCSNFPTRTGKLIYQSEQNQD